MKDFTSTKMNDFLKHWNIPVTLYSQMLTFKDSDQSFKLDAVLLKTMTIYKDNVGHSKLQDRKMLRDFAK